MDPIRANQLFSSKEKADCGEESFFRYEFDYVEIMRFYVHPSFNMPPSQHKCKGPKEYIHDKRQLLSNRPLN